jgi:signal transduction histidine kinase
LPNSATLQRIADSGPYSYDGYLVAYASVASDTSVYVARRPDFSSLAVPMFCIFDRKGILKSHNFSGSLAYLSKLQREKVTGQLEDQDQLFRVRVFEIQPGYFILTGYPAQRAMISRTDIDMLMLRLAVLQVLGLLILGYFLGRRLLAPLRALGMGIEKVAEGDWKEIPLDQPPMQGSGDEIESVALSFNKMVRELSSAQTRLIEVQKELAKKDKLAALGRFSAGIAHEINNPLGTILVNAGLLKESLEKGHEISVEEVEEIADEVKRCKNIISTLRTYTTQTQPVLSEYDFNEAFRQLTDYISGLAEYKAITFKISDQANGRIRIDMAAMKQVFANLVKNAADAMSDNKYKELVISAVNESDHFAISFCDNGKGFECEPELIFEPLFTTKAQGTGLGLIICQAIIEGHNGKIEARRLDEMTELKILLPFTADRDNTAEETL